MEFFNTMLQKTSKNKENVVLTEKERQENMRKSYEMAQKQVSEEAKSRVLGWIEEGQSLVLPEKRKAWKKYVVKSYKDKTYHGVEIDRALEIMQALEDGASIEQAKAILGSQGHSGLSEVIVRNLLVEFSSRGPEFYEATAWTQLPPKKQKFIEEKKKENIKLLEKRKTKEESEKQQNLMNQALLWIEKGQALIFPERYADWEK